MSEPGPCAVSGRVQLSSTEARTGPCPWGNHPSSNINISEVAAPKVFALILKYFYDHRLMIKSEQRQADDGTDVFITYNCWYYMLLCWCVCLLSMSRSWLLSVFCHFQRAEYEWLLFIICAAASLSSSPPSTHTHTLYYHFNIPAWTYSAKVLTEWFLWI